MSATALALTTFNPGRARHKMIVLRPVKTKDEFNSDVVTLVPFATIRAEVLDLGSAGLGGRESIAIQQRFAEAKYLIKTQFIRGMEREFRLRWQLAAGELDLDILDVSDPIGMGQFTQIVARDFIAR